MSSLKALHAQGQAVWLDFVARGFVEKGDLARLVAEDGIRGVTSNPAIFEKAIAGSDEYDDAIRAALAQGDRSVIDLYESLAVVDIRKAADVLRPVFDETGGADGFVSLEVSPYLALDTEATVAEARRLWADVDRPNLMVKVPGTAPGVPAVRTLIGEGINVNVTLLFARRVYEEVAEAYIAGLEDLAARGGDVSKVASVASFFVSRIDTAVDALLAEKAAAANDPEEKSRIEELLGEIAIANAKLAYRSYKLMIEGDRWKALAAKGARPQRLLWASTGTKNKAYSDVLYVDELIGPDTVNTVPPATLDAFRDHGTPAATLERSVDEAEAALATLDRIGISLDAVTDQLVTEGVTLFADAADKLLAAVALKRATVLGDRMNRQTIAAEADLAKAVSAAAETWRANGTIRRLWAKDASVWTNADEAKWLGWLTSTADGRQKLADYQAFAADVKAAGFTDVLLLGMGGSSLGPEVLAETFGPQPGFPKLRILDSTDPAQVRATEAAVTLATTLIIVSSKSGSTTEPNVMLAYFFDRLKQTVGDRAGSHVVAVTDPGSSLEKVAQRDGFRRIFHGEPTIGGRYSVLSPFGLVPAAAAGIDVAAFLDSADVMVHACGPDVPPAANPGVQLGLLLGLAARAGRDKMTMLASPALADFGAWTEQLVAESTGKNGKAIIPVDGEPLASPSHYGSDRVFVDLRLVSDAASPHDAEIRALEQAGHPIVRIVLRDRAEIAQEFFRFEIATAVAGAVLGINPFDQPDVEASKIKTRELTAAFEAAGRLPAETPVASSGSFDVFTDPKNAEALRAMGADADPASWLKAHFSRVKPGDYVALLAYLCRSPAHVGTLQTMRLAVRARRKVATCVGFGPRFLHSTGQAYKGGPDTGVVLQITADDHPDLPIPGQSASFGIVKAAQARGDFGVLAERGRRALRIHIKTDVTAGLASLAAAVDKALS
ncbi:bifunctional transaldolase/phosoglucose isomerase [Rhodoplanes sp. TEM]|uniref:Transaldolase n=1 Tax=Rhodoplanes tepidamans TaxID=200616 RepID=A0ABT5JD14_RHOTP|nr:MULTISPECIES: bifunctional transaldolase/phosoglucose isomerase [Rhodoplanes]MDC7786950.1 bifunctional transaldolase/phosoglucose isomerase [Rhodoplanes tepidamans]MDC7985059.1 bifunctional transaldolase/phosoglucose isomerase [Rhodoplanes sp. TEM]MDQ0355353.1 transaldolase/glucose-6-phosphate isomerase [Rhodoplanes tepidamans]